MTLGDKIRELRRAAGLTQGDLAKMLNTTKQTIGKYEQGIVSNLPLSRIVELANALNTSPAYLMGWTNERRRMNQSVRIEAIMNNLDENEQLQLLFSNILEEQKLQFHVLFLQLNAMQPIELAQRFLI